MTTCPGCGLELPPTGTPPDGKLNNSPECAALYEGLSAYTASLGDLAFIHQHAVDAYGAQHAPEGARSIRTAFALAGLYLACDRGFDGRQVQRAHMLMAKRPREWPLFQPPSRAGNLTVSDVLDGPESQRQERLRAWAASVWAAWSHEHARVVSLVHELLD